MVRLSRTISSAGTLALAALLFARSGPEARAQVFGHYEEDSGASAALGSAVARAGDLDGDGFEDFIVGGPNAVYNKFSGCGTVVLVSGAGGAIQWLSATTVQNFGAAVEGRIDVDGDGFQDVLIGAPLDSSHAANGGAVFAYSPHLNYDPLIVYGGSAGANLGSSVRSLQADVDGDGFEDFIVGAPGIDSAHVVSSGQNSILFTNNGQNGSGFGMAVCRGGDLDNDGICDYVVGSPFYVDSGGTTTGRVTAFSGKDGSKLWSVDGAADSRFGKSLTQPGDLDGDGQGDIVVGAPQHLDPAGNKTGCVTVLSGANHSVLWKVFGDKAGDTFGHSVHAVGGDIDDDGTVDFVVGAPQHLGSDVGYARTISGATGATLFSYTEHTNDPNTKSDYGSAVCGGDWNNDGRPDVAIGGATSTTATGSSRPG
jgi:predicted lipoprotein with Yx(FWY)xxD motif